MEENNQNQQQTNTEDIKSQTTEQTNTNSNLNKEQMKQSANEAKNLFIGFFKNPILQIEKIAHSQKNQFLMFAIILVIVWLVATLLGEVISILKSYSLMSAYYSSFALFLRNSVSNVFSVIKAVVAPVLSLVVLTLTVYLINKGEKKSFMNVATSVVIAKMPVIVASIISLLGALYTPAYKLTSPFSGFCGVLSTVLMYFTIKSLYSENDDNSVMKKFVIIMGIFYIAKFMISFLGISI